MAHEHALTLGSRRLTESEPDETHSFVFDVLSEGVGFGVAAGVKQVVTSLLADGDLVRITRYGNREITFRVEVTGPDLGSLAWGEAALRGEIGRRNTLTWQPPDDLAVPTVFEVVTSEMTQVFDDLDELDKRRVFEVTLTCAPHGRSADLVTITALPTGAAAASVDTCDSTSGWSTGITANADTLSTSGGAVWSTDASGNDAVALYRAASVDVSAHPYFVLEWKVTPAGPGILVMGMPAASDPYPSELRRVALADGWFRSTWAVDPGDLNSGFQLAFAGAGVASIGIRDVSKSGIIPGTTPRQLSRIIKPGGTERTPASIHVSAATTLGGLVIVHTQPEDGSGNSPNLRRWRVSGQTEVPTATAFSGQLEPIAVPSNAFFAEVPTSAVPYGAYQLVVRVHMPTGTPATADIYYSVSTEFPDSTTREGYSVDFQRVTFTDADWHMVPLAVLTLPSVRTAAGMVQVAISASTSNPQVYLDEAWLFRVDDDCALSIIKTDRPHLWLDSPDLDSSEPRVWVGDGLATKVHPGEGLEAMGTHVLHHDGTAVFTAALDDYPSTEATLYPHWSNNAAK